MYRQKSSSEPPLQFFPKPGIGNIIDLYAKAKGATSLLLFIFAFHFSDSDKAYNRQIGRAHV